MPVIVVANPKGGVGKTTLSTNLAGYLASRGHAVMLGDVDRQQSSRTWLDQRPAGLPKISAWETSHGDVDQVVGIERVEIAHRDARRRGDLELARGGEHAPVGPRLLELGMSDEDEDLGTGGRRRFRGRRGFKGHGRDARGRLDVAGNSGWRPAGGRQ